MDAPLSIMATPAVGRIIDAFSDCFGLRIALFSALGEETMVGRNRPCGAYCIYVREILGRRDRCLAMDAEKREQALRENRLVAYTCHAGMTEAVLPVYLQDLHAGFLMIGQFRTKKCLPARYAAGLTAGLAANEKRSKKLGALYEKTPYYDAKKAAGIYELFRTLLDYILSRNLLEVRQDYALGRIVTMMRENLARPLTLPGLAAYAGVSVAKACSLFKNAYGSGVMRTFMNMRLDEAARLLRTREHISVKEASRAAGYEDPYYFSRAFKRRFGCAPSLFKTRRD